MTTCKSPVALLGLVMCVFCVTSAFADLCDYVDPFVGTAGTGHTFPGACVPFGLIQASPDTGNGDWAHCSGYVYGDTNLYGFSQTHLNGTGCADLGDIRLLPGRPVTLTFTPKGEVSPSDFRKALTVTHLRETY